MPSQIESPISITPLTQLADQVTAEVKRLSKWEGHLSFEDKQELSSSCAPLESLKRTVKWFAQPRLVNQSATAT
jgi:hypothetical protein